MRRLTKLKRSSKIKRKEKDLESARKKTDMYNRVESENAKRKNIMSSLAGGSIAVSILTRMLLFVSYSFYTHVIWLLVAFVGTVELFRWRHEYRWGWKQNDIRRRLPSLLR